MSRNLFFIIPLLLCASPVLLAQSKSEKEVAEAVNVLRKAMLDGDSVALSRLAHNAVSYGHSSGKVEDKAAFVSSLASGRSDFVSLELSAQVIQVAGKTATVRHNLAAQINDGGKAGSVKLYVLLVWIKTGGRWQLLARQAVRL